MEILFGWKRFWFPIFMAGSKYKRLHKIITHYKMRKIIIYPSFFVSVGAFASSVKQA